MEVGIMYPTMEEFKLAVRQFAIKKEFYLGVEKSCKTIYMAFYKSGDEGHPCPWRIIARKMKGSATVEVNNVFIISFILLCSKFHVYCLCLIAWMKENLACIIACTTIYTYMHFACMHASVR
jgi:hypothetical protein